MPKPSPVSASSGKRPRALVLAPEAPYPVIGGGPMRTASLIEYLRARYDVEVIVCREPEAPDPAPAFPPDIAVHVLHLPWHSRSAPARGLRNLSRFVRGVPPLIDRFRGFSEAIGAAIAGREFDVGVIEHFWCAEYAQVLRPVCRRLVLDLHNIESVLLQRCSEVEGTPHKLLFRRWASSCRRMESAALPQFDLTLVPSQADAGRVPVAAEVLPNTIPFVPRPNGSRRFEIAFSGNLGYHPNQTAIRWFLADVWPNLLKHFPGLKLRLIGKNQQSISRFVGEDPRIIVTGPVQDAIEALAGSAVAIAPVLSGSGTRVKIIEAWAAGLPVVSTTIGAEGLPGKPEHDILIADTAEVFAEKIAGILQNPALQSELGDRGRRLYERELTWNSAWKLLNDIGL